MKALTEEQPMTHIRPGKTPKYLCMVLCAMIVCTIFVNRALAQADQGAITGLVQDPTGAVVSNAQVTLTNVDNGLTLKSQTDGSGNYVFSPVKIGNYKVTVAAPGFTSTTQENVQLHVQDRLSINVQLKTDESNTSVTVTEAPPLLQTEEGPTGQITASKTIN